MATFLDTVLISNFAPIFVFLVIYVIVYGVLEFSKPFGDKMRGLHGLLALVLGLIASFSQPVVKMITFSIPWFTIILLFYFFIIFILKLFTGDKSFEGAVMKDNRVRTYTIVFAILILLFGLGQSFGQQTLEKGSWDGLEQQNTTTKETTISATNDFIERTGVGNDQITGTQVATNDFGTNLLNTLVNPKVLGLILIMLMGAFAMFFLASD